MWRGVWLALLVDVVCACRDWHGCRAARARSDTVVRAHALPSQVSSTWGLSRSFLGFIVLPIAATTPLLAIPIAWWLEGDRPTRRALVGGVIAVAGCVALKPDGDGVVLEHFYLGDGFQGRGIGAAVLRRLLAEADAAGRAVRLGVLKGSPAARLYERHGFVWTHAEPFDDYYRRGPGGAAVEDRLTNLTK